ncbi:hypothetical protein OROGR_018357 [Orobanche gracilis]
MAGETESLSTAVEDSAKYGFDRGEMYKSNLAWTVDPYDRHVFLCYKSHESWPSRVEDSDSDPLPKLLASALQARKNDISVKTRLTICEGSDDVNISDGDVLIFPEMIVYSFMLFHIVPPRKQGCGSKVMHHAPGAVRVRNGCATRRIPLFCIRDSWGIREGDSGGVVFVIFQSKKSSLQSYLSLSVQLKEFPKPSLSLMFAEKVLRRDRGLWGIFFDRRIGYIIIYNIGLKDSDIDGFVEDVLVKGKPWLSGVQEELTGSYVFVCAHNLRDRRCGVCRPILIEKFEKEIGSKNLKNQVFVTACSHIGGHKYAGNVIIFSADSDGKILGNWYGYVTPSDVLELLDKQIGEGEVIDRLWRGQMGAKVKEAKPVEEPKHANETNANINEKEPQEITIQEYSESVGSCCQGANGFSCCRDENVVKKPIKNEVKGFPSWMEKFEQRHVLTSLAMVSAASAIAVAYGFYRRAR